MRRRLWLVLPPVGSGLLILFFGACWWIANNENAVLDAANFSDPLEPDTWKRIRLEGMLKDKDPRIRRRAAQELGEMGYHASPAVPALIQVAENDSDFEVSAEAVEAVKNIDPVAAHKAGW
jgi:hypothetical protein